jgi:1-acyl-sn-glycerol-3-phosphate acyltransferase
LLSSIARLLLKIGGWTLVGDHPSVPKAVIIAAPHTSNWDGIWGLIAKVALRIDVHFFGKDTLFWFPLGILLRVMGGIPLDRANPGSSVDKAARGFRDADSYYFAMAPEGTRRHKRYWKTGFYRIALAAGVPVVLAFFDYEQRRLGIGATIELGGNPDEDLARIREFYADHARPKHAGKMGPVAFDPAARVTSGASAGNGTREPGN